ncbi:hypothetical protein Bca52824_015864 [Brassica carinata]|uniref:DYW domain-containing protein n=1 Tax=Brassica carinata TaxID=52824 RepID=A0A8X7W3E9_BRACI|nr:hypothetical protein Bca52824_015864 [Brassica carinata]
MASNYYSAQIKQCLEFGTRNQSRHLKTIHGHIIKTLPYPETILHNRIIHGYAKLRNTTYARRVFDEITQPNLYSWNSLLMAYSQSGNHLSEMERTFKKLPERDGVSWNLLISGYSLSGLVGEAVKACNTMMREGSGGFLTRVSVMTMLKLCSDNGRVGLGKQVHGQVVRRGFESYLLVGSALMDMYAKFGFISDAKTVFHGLKDRNTVMYNSLMGGLLASGMVDDAKKLFRGMEKDSVSWTAMIKGLAQNGLEKEAIEFFRGMKMEGLAMDQFTFGSVLPACGGLGAIKEGKKVHACVIRTNFQDNVYVGSALVDMYCKCKCIDYAKTVFDGMRQKNVVSWTAMVVGYGQSGRAEEAPDHYTLGQAISACANISSLEEGSQFHGKAVTSGLVHYVIVSNSLVTLYGKCGNIDDSTKLFNEMSFRDEVSWTAMVSAYAQFGRAIEAIDLFDRMVQHGLKPDGVTLTGVISACSRAGLVEKGQRYFELMTNEYGIVPSNGHYSCMIDLFSRSGRLEEAMSFINGMPFPQMRLVGSLYSAHEMGLCGAVEAGDEREESEKRTWTELDQVERKLHSFSADDESKCVRIATLLLSISPESLVEIIVRDAVRFHRFKDGTCSCGDFW